MSSFDDEPKPQIAEILALLSRLSERFEPDDGEMKDWITENFGNPVIIELLQESTIAMLRVLDAIGQLEPVNSITVSKQYRIPKGTVSKTTRRLFAMKLISKETLPNNKKEIMFRTTPLGKELYVAHRAFDQQMERGFVQFLKRYDGDELQFIVRVLHDILETSFLNPEYHLGSRNNA